MFLPLSKILCPPEYEIFPWQRWLRPRRPVSGWPSWRTARTRSYGQSPSSWSTEDTSVIILDLIFWREATSIHYFVRTYVITVISILRFAYQKFTVDLIFAFAVFSFYLKYNFADFVVFLTMTDIVHMYFYAYWAFYFKSPTTKAFNLRNILERGILFESILCLTGWSQWASLSLLSLQNDPFKGHKML